MARSHSERVAVTISQVSAEVALRAGDSRIPLEIQGEHPGQARRVRRRPRESPGSDARRRLSGVTLSAKDDIRDA